MCKEIKPSIYYVGSKDVDREYFDQLIPLHMGTSYNSYLVKGSEKTALIDTVYPPREQEIIEKLEKLGIDKIDYIIANHGEQDHSGSIPKLLEIYPEAQVVTNAKCKELLMDLLLIDESRINVIKDGETLSLGDKTLEFMLAPWVHWPDTMFTYIQEDKILFTCDFLGAHTSDDALFVEDKDAVRKAAKKYYAEIMMPFRAIFKKYLAKIEELNPDMIAPSHGPVYQNPSYIVDAYKRWADDSFTSKKVIIPYITMYGSTGKMVEYLVENLKRKGFLVKTYDVMNLDLGDLAVDIVNASTIVFASPMVLAGLHPNIVGLISTINALKPKTKFVSLVGSYNWGGVIVDQLKSLIKNLKAEFLEPVMVKGKPKEPDYNKLDTLINEIVEKNK